MTIEFVLMTPLLLSALVFSFEFGKAFWAYDTVTRDLRGAVRYLSRLSPACVTLANNSAPTRAAVEGLARKGVTSGGTDHFPWSDSASFTYAAAPASPLTTPTWNVNAEAVTMTASVPITLSFLTVLNRFAKLSGGSALNTSYPLSISYQSRCIGN